MGDKEKCNFAAVLFGGVKEYDSKARLITHRREDAKKLRFSTCMHTQTHWDVMLVVKRGYSVFMLGPWGKEQERSKDHSFCSARNATITIIVITSLANCC